MRKSSLRIVGRIFAFAVLGMITGAVSAFGFLVEVTGTLREIGQWINFLAPGAVFGAVFGLWLAVAGWLSPLRALVWLACAIVGYAIAEFCLFVTMNESLLRDQKTPALALAAMIAGMLGGGFLAIATRLFIPGVRWLLPTAAGATLALVLFVINLHSLELFAFFAIWQAGYAAAFALALPMRS